MSEGKSNESPPISQPYYSAAATSYFIGGDALLDGGYPVIPNYRTSNASLQQVRDYVAQLPPYFTGNDITLNTILKPGDYYADYVAFTPTIDARRANNPNDLNSTSNSPTQYIVARGYYGNPATTGYFLSMVGGAISPIYGQTEPLPTVAGYTTSNDSTAGKVKLYHFTYRVKPNNSLGAIVNAVGSEFFSIPDFVTYSSIGDARWSAYEIAPAPSVSQISSPDEYLYHYQR